MENQTGVQDDGLWPDERLISWHIPVRCYSGFDGQLPLPKELVPDADAVAALAVALHNPSCQVMAVVGEAGTGKTTALGWLLHTLEPTRINVGVTAFRCASRTYAELHDFLVQTAARNQTQWLIVDGLDELRGEEAYSLDDLFEPILPRLLDGTARIVFSVRSEIGQILLKPPAEGLLRTCEWDLVWAGVETVAGLRIAILRLQELRRRDVELYAARRGLSADFVAHLRSLYDLRELVRRFFLLVKLCDLSEQLAVEEWKQIRARNRLYERLLTTWLIAEGTRDPQRLSLQMDDLLALLERAAFHIEGWTGDSHIPLAVRLGDTLNDAGRLELRGVDAYAVAAALVHANIVCETGFVHKSMEEYLLARALSKLVRAGQAEPLSPTRITDDVISFLSEDEVFRRWLDQNQDRLTSVNSEYLPHLVRLLQRQGRAIPKLNLQGAKLNNLQLLGIGLRGADLRKADFAGTQLGPADLTDANLRGTILRHTSVWTVHQATDIYPSADGPNCLWLVHPTANHPYGLAVVIQIGANSGRLAAYYQYDPRSEKLSSDGRALYRMPRTTQKEKAEVTQWLGENIAIESWWMSVRSLPLASSLRPGAIWQVSTDRAVLYDDDVELQRFTYPNGEVRGTLGVPPKSEFAAHQIDGFCLIGTRLWALGLNRCALISDELLSGQPLQQLMAVGQSRVVFNTEAGWHTWTSEDEPILAPPELAGVKRVIALPDSGFALVRPATVEFVEEDFSSRGSQAAAIDLQASLVGIKREGTRALVALDYQGFRLIDEQSGQEVLEWLNLRAQGARFDKRTELSSDLRAALTGAGARDETLAPTPPALGKIMRMPTTTTTSAQSLFEVLLITVNKHEFDAVYQLFSERLGKAPEAIYKPKRAYFDLGLVGGARVGLVRSQMGSTQPGATTTTTLQAMREVCPGYLIAVGIAFGIDPDKQSIGQILYSEKLQDYNLIKAATNKQTNQITIIPRGDKVSPNPTFLNRVQSAADIWRLKGIPIPISPVLLLSGDTLVDNLDYRKQLLELFPEAGGGEMEATGIYSASREDETPWMIIKAICDYADGQKGVNKEERQREAAHNAALFVFHLIEQGGLK